jgi:pSer/pThr/pTyr-binding forkhead associated (FHA) protein
MPVFTVNDQHYALRPGQNRLGAGAGADVAVSDDDSLGVQAIVDVREAAHPVIRRAKPTAAVRVNGVELLDPTPLIHGDKVEIGGRELLYTDDSKTGATQVMSARRANISATPVSQQAASATGGRLVSLVDGKEYEVKAAGLTIGRDASSDIVLMQRDVSRKHAAVFRVTDGSYEIRDFSANGVHVNEKRVQKRSVLAPADLIRIGTEEFRFRADPEPVAPAIPAKTAATATPPSPPPVPRQALATLEVRNIGPANGRRFDIRAPHANVGRGAKNDVVLDDETVSESHASLQRRNDGWYVVDHGSANGSYVSGKRFTGEQRLAGSDELRFGGVKMKFHPADLPPEPVKASVASPAFAVGVVSDAAVNLSRPQLNPTTSVPVVVLMPPSTQEEPQKSGVPKWIWGALGLAVVTAAALFLLDS